MHFLICSFVTETERRQNLWTIVIIEVFKVA